MKLKFCFPYQYVHTLRDPSVTKLTIKAAPQQPKMTLTKASLMAYFEIDIEHQHCPGTEDVGLYTKLADGNGYQYFDANSMSKNAIKEKVASFEIDFSGPGITEVLYVAGKPKSSTRDLDA